MSVIALYDVFVFAIVTVALASESDVCSSLIRSQFIDHLV